MQMFNISHCFQIVVLHETIMHIHAYACAHFPQLSTSVEVEISKSIDKRMFSNIVGHTNHRYVWLDFSNLHQAINSFKLETIIDSLPFVWCAFFIKFNERVAFYCGLICSFLNGSAKALKETLNIFYSMIANGMMFSCFSHFLSYF